MNQMDRNARETLLARINVLSARSCHEQATASYDAYMAYLRELTVDVDTLTDYAHHCGNRGAVWLYTDCYLAWRSVEEFVSLLIEQQPNKGTS